MIHAQHRLRLTMQHVYGHCGNLGNECADNAAALGTFGLTSSHNVATRWIHHNFDASVCFDGCNNISEVLERLQHIRTNATSLPQGRSQRCFHHRVHCAFCAFRVAYFRLCLLLSTFTIWVIASTCWTVFFFFHPLLPYQVLTTTSSTTCGILCWKCFLSSRLVVLSPPISWKSTWPRSHSLVTLLLIYFVTRKKCLPLHDDTLGTAAHWSSLCL